MPTDLDHALRDLERQIHHFSMTLEDRPDAHISSSTAPISESLPEQRITRDRYQPNGTGQTPGNGHFTHRYHDPSRMTNNPTIPSAHVARSNTVKQPSRHHASPMLSRSVSSGGTRTKHNNDPSPPPVPSASLGEEDDLRLAMQCAWSFLETDQRENQPAVANIPPPEPQPVALQESKAVSPAPLPMPTPTRSVMARLYIIDSSNYKSIQLNNLMTAAMVIQYMKKKNVLDSSKDWTLFEVAASHGVERPLRDWEIVMDVSAVWDPEMNNAFVLKKYPYYASLTNEAILQKRNSAIQGWLSMEYKKGKWQKRFFYLTENAIHYAKDSKGSNSTVFCHLSAYDVYTVIQPPRSAPSKYLIGLRAQDSARIYERQEDYIRILSAEDSDTMRNWVLSIRAAKGILHYQQFPQRVLYPYHPGEWARTDRDKGQQQSTDDAGQISRSLRRHKSTRDVRAASKADDNSRGHIVDGTASLGRHASKRMLSRGNTLRRQDADPAMDPNENELSDSPLRQTPSPSDDQQQSTLIQITDKVTFSKGSLLERSQSKLTRSKSMRDSQARHTAEPAIPANSNGNGGRSGSGAMPPSTSAGEPRRHGSLRRRPTGSKDRERSNRHPESPMPTGGPLLQLDGTAEQMHTKELRERQLKPLLSFTPSTDTRSRS